MFISGYICFSLNVNSAPNNNVNAKNGPFSLCSVMLNFNVKAKQSGIIEVGLITIHKRRPGKVLVLLMFFLFTGSVGIQKRNLCPGGSCPGVSVWGSLARMSKLGVSVQGSVS